MQAKVSDLRIVQVGCGGMSRQWLESAGKLPGLEIVGLVDIVEAAARARAEEQNLTGAVIGTNLVDVLEECKPDIVFNCTIPEVHYRTTLDALQHGCHVLCEKPMADSVARAQEMIQTAERANKLLAIIQNRRYDPNIRRVHNVLSSGSLGQITTVNSDFYIGAHFGGFRDHMEHVLLLDMAIHTFDAARFLIGADPVAVYCKEWNPAGSWYDHDASAIAIFEMSNGVIYTYRGSWCAEGRPTTWEGDWRFVGAQGTLLWDGGRKIEGQVVDQTAGFISTHKDLEVPIFDPGEKKDGHLGLIREFVHCVRTGEIPETNGADNIKSLAMVFGAIESAESGKRVEIHY